MNFIGFFGLFLIDFSSAWRCREEIGRIKELVRKNRELKRERDELAAEKGRFCNEYFDEIDVRFESFHELKFFQELNAAKSKLKEENEELKRKLEALQVKDEVEFLGFSK